MILIDLRLLVVRRFRVVGVMMMIWAGRRKRRADLATSGRLDHECISSMNMDH